jgi:hypothetical protein
MTGNLDQGYINLDTPNGNGEFDLPPPSPFLDKNGQPIKRKSKLIIRREKQTSNKIKNLLGIRCLKLPVFEYKKRDKMIYL